ncbi:MAG: 50S ribosomal protein L15 [Endomicrobiia bacterium]
MVILLSNLRPAKGSRHRRKRLGCGEGSGHGGSGSTRGMKGQRSRSGEGKNPGFEGGQMPLVRVIPKRGFSNEKFRTVFQEVSLINITKQLPKNVEEVTPEILKKYNLIKTTKQKIKIISGNLKLDRKLKIYANKVTKSVEETIKKSGGEIIFLDNNVH